MAGFGDLAALVGAALCLAFAALAAPIDADPEPLDRNAATSWTLIAGDPDKAPQSGASAKPKGSRPVPLPVPVQSLPLPGDVVDAISVLSLSRKCQIGRRLSNETATHACQLLAAHDPACARRRYDEVLDDRSLPARRPAGPTPPLLADVARGAGAVAGTRAMSKAGAIIPACAGGAALGVIIAALVPKSRIKDWLLFPCRTRSGSHD